MKYRPKDMLDNLATGEDRVAKVNEIKEELKEAGFTKIRVTRRKLAAGEKVYFQLEWPYDLESASSWRRHAEHIIQHQFPNAHLTSAGTDNATFAEY